MALDITFRAAIAIAACSGCLIYFGTKGKLLKPCHLIAGVSAVILCAITFINQ
ncbi:MAG: hypothetical protein ABFD18_18500 [Syntrophomonas sp.]